MNDKLTLEDFAPDAVTAPLELPAGTYQIAIRPANGPADPAPLLWFSNFARWCEASIVAHLDASGQPKLTVFVNDTSSLAAGKRVRRPSYRCSTCSRRACERQARVHEPHQPEPGNGRSACGHDQRLGRRGGNHHPGDRTCRPDPA